MSCRYPLNKNRLRPVKQVQILLAGPICCYRAEALSLSWTARGLESLEISDCIVHDSLILQKPNWLHFVLGFSSGPWSLFPFSTDKRATISVRSHMKPPSYNHPLTLPWTLNKDSLRISVFELRIWNWQEEAHKQRRVLPKRDYRVYFNEISMIYGKFNRKLYSNWLKWAMFSQVTWNWELMNREVKSQIFEIDSFITRTSFFGIICLRIWRILLVFPF